MKNFIVKILLFSIPLIIAGNQYINYSQNYMINKFGPTTEQQIDESFRNARNRKYDQLILGNSRIYRGINPDKLSISSYNFSHDNDSFNQGYYKIKYLEEHGIKYKYLILGVDYTEFSFLADSRNYIYYKYFGEGYKKDFGDEESKLKVVDDDNFNQFMSDKFSKTLPIIIEDFVAKIQDLSLKEETKIQDLSLTEPKENKDKDTDKNSRPDPNKKGKDSRPVPNPGHLKINGQYILEGIAHADDKIEREYKRIPIQVNYFEKILKYAKDNNIEVFLVMPPMRDVELINFDDETKMEHSNFINNEIKPYSNVHYLDYSEIKEFTLKDYTDTVHLNAEAADRFSEILDKDIAQIIRK